MIKNKKRFGVVVVSLCFVFFLRNISKEENCSSKLTPKNKTYIQGRYIKKRSYHGSNNKSTKYQQREEISIAETQYERQRQLRRFCLSQKNNTVYNPAVHKQKNMWYNDKHGIVYCYVPKAACTNWKRVMQTLNHKMGDELDTDDKESVHDLPHPNFANFKASDINKRLSTYFSFLFVRHPFERLVSSYRNKFEDPYSDYFQKTIGVYILSLYRPHMKPEKAVLGRGVTFPEFVRYILDVKKSGKIGRLNEHWQLIERLCHPCHMKYTFVGKMETLLDDADLVLKFVGLDDIIQFPYNARDKYSTPAEFYMRKYFRQLSNRTIDELFDLYQNDFKAFGYEIDETWRPL